MNNLSKVLLPLLAGTLAVAALIVPNAESQIRLGGSPHDFSSETVHTWNTTGDLCQACHTPHNAPPSAVGAPLWNHTTTTATYTLYDSATFDGNVAQPAGVSLACLSCHDGTLGIDAYGSSPGTGLNYIAGSANLGTDLSTSHPIGVTYDSTLVAADGELFATSTAALGGTIASEMLFGTGNTQLECASCHDVHNWATVDTPFLRITNVGSALCVTCHDKL